MEQTTCPHCGHTFDNPDRPTDEKVEVALERIQDKMTALMRVIADQSRVIAQLTAHYAALSVSGPPNLWHGRDNRN